MSFETVAQKAIFGALSGNISANVYDQVPPLPEGMPDNRFPYVVVGDDTTARWDNDSQLGAEITVTLHVWSRGKGWTEAKAILGEIYDLLHRATLTATGYQFLNVVQEFSTTAPDAANLRHGVQRFRVIVQKEFD